MLWPTFRRAASRLSVVFRFIYKRHRRPNLISHLVYFSIVYFWIYSVGRSMRAAEALKVASKNCRIYARWATRHRVRRGEGRNWGERAGGRQPDPPYTCFCVCTHRTLFTAQTTVAAPQYYTTNVVAERTNKKRLA